MANTVPFAQIRSDAQGQINAWTNLAEGFIQTLQANAAATLSTRLPNVNIPADGTPFESILFQRIGEEPVITGSTVFSVPGSNPGSGSFSSVANPVVVTPPSYDVTSPTISIPAAPSLTTPDTPTSPITDDVDVPVAPTIELPTAPTISSVVFPDAPTLALPTFSAAAPDAPTSFIETNTFEWTEEGLPTPLLDAIQSKLLTDVNDGGYGIEPADEEALWSRARDRELRQLDAVETETEELYANRGYSLPPGAMLNAFVKARSDAEDRLNEAEREIAIKRADLFRDLRRFAMEQGTSVENVYLQHYGFRLERLLNALRFSAEYAVTIHDAYIRQFNAELQRYSTLAEVYRTQLQGALTQVQIYEAEVRAAVSRLEANRIDVQLYEALISAATSRVNLYEAQVRGAALVADIERLKVEIYRSEVQAFAAQVDANESQLRAYTAQIQGEQAKVDIFRSEVAAYSDRVRAAATEQSAENEVVRVQIQRKAAELDEYRAAIAKYQVDVQTEVERINSVLRRYSTDSDVYRAAIAGYEALSRVDLQESDNLFKAVAEETLREQENARLEFQAAKEQLDTRFTAANAGSELAGRIVVALNSQFQGVAIEDQDTT
jgi:hypothetical protein